jgi:hypothetical protein
MTTSYINTYVNNIIARIINDEWKKAKFIAELCEFFQEANIMIQEWHNNDIIHTKRNLNKIEAMVSGCICITNMISFNNTNSKCNGLSYKYSLIRTKQNGTQTKIKATLSSITDEFTNYTFKMKYYVNKFKDNFEN